VRNSGLLNIKSRVLYRNQVGGEKEALEGLCLYHTLICYTATLRELTSALHFHN